MKTIALSMSFYRHGDGGAVDAFVLPTLPASTPPLSPSRHNQLPSSRRHSVSSSSILSTSSPFSSTDIERRIVPPSVEISILEPMGNGTFGGVYFARDEATGKKGTIEIMLVPKPSITFLCVHESLLKHA